MSKERAQNSNATREIAIFWDFENVPLPGWCTAAEAAKFVHTAVSKYGRIVERRLYYDFGGGGSGPRDCSGLDSSGFDLVNTPRRKQKETLDKKLIADVLTFAWDSAVRNENCKPCVVLVTSDGDYAYTLSKLRDRGVMSIVMVGAECVARILVDNADIVLSFEGDVIGGSSNTNTNNSSSDNKLTQLNETPTSSNHVYFKNLPFSFRVQDIVRFCEHVHACPVRQATIKITNAYCSAHVEFVSSNDGARIIRMSQNSHLVIDGCNILAQKDTHTSHLHTTLAKTTKNSTMYYANPNYISTTNNTNTLPTALSNKQTIPTEKTTPNLFFKNLPRPCRVIDFVHFLQTSHRSPVRRAILETGTDPHASWCFAHVQFKHVHDAMRILHTFFNKDGQEQLNVLNFGGRIIWVGADTRIPPPHATGDSQDFYLDGATIKNQVNSSVNDGDTKSVPSAVSQNNAKAKNIFIKNLQASTNVDSLRHFFEVVHNCPIERIILESIQSNSISSWRSAHIEFVHAHDADRIIAISKKTVEGGLKLEGHVIMANADTKIPIMTAGEDPSLFFSRSKRMITSSSSSLPSLSSNNNNDTNNNHKNKKAGETKPIETNKFLTVKNLPQNIDLCALVRFLEQSENFNCLIRCAIIRPPPNKKMTWYNAHIELMDPQGAKNSKLFNCIQDGILYHDRMLFVQFDDSNVMSSDEGVMDPIQQYDFIPSSCVSSTKGPSDNKSKGSDFVESPSQKDPIIIHSDSSDNAMTHFFCQCVRTEQQTIAKHSFTDPIECWTTAASVGDTFHKHSSQTDKNKSKKKEYRRFRDIAVSQKYIQVGRRKLSTQTATNNNGGNAKRMDIIVPCPSSNGVASSSQSHYEDLSLEVYLRLTARGWDFMENYGMNPSTAVQSIDTKAEMNKGVEMNCSNSINDNDVCNDGKTSPLLHRPQDLAVTK